MPAVVFCLFAFFCSLLQKPAKESLIAGVEDSVIKIVIILPDKDGSILPIGTGFFAEREDTVVTAAHVYWEAGKTMNDKKGGTIFATKPRRSGEVFRVPLVAIVTDDENDIALFKLDPGLIRKQSPNFEIKPLRLSEQEVSPGQQIFFVGYFGSDLFPMVSRGIVAGPTLVQLASGQRSDEIVIDVPVNRGQSGSPLLSLDDKEVVGMITAAVPTSLTAGAPPSHSGLSRATKAGHMKKLIRSAVPR